MALPRTSSGTPSVALTKWLGTMWPVRENQNADSPVSTLPLSGVGFGCTTSYVEIRSEATIRRRSPRSYISRTFPEARSGRSATVVTGAMLAAGYVAFFAARAVPPRPKLRTGVRARKPHAPRVCTPARRRGRPRIDVNGPGEELHRQPVGQPPVDRRRRLGHRPRRL